MPITTDTFELEHFDALLRGLTVARDKHNDLLIEIQELETKNDDLREKFLAIETDLEDAAVDKAAWEQLILLIQDVGRGIRTLDELLDHVKATA